MKIGFIGLGDQGRPMAQRLLSAGLDLVVWARSPAQVLPFSGSGATIAASRAELGAACDIVCVCVFDGAGARDVLLGPHGVLGAMRPGSVVVVHTTMAPEDVRELAAQATAGRVDLLDAPVSGGRGQALAGRLVVMAGGRADLVERCRPVLEAYADTIVPMGPVGAGQLAKLLNNALLTANLAVALDAFALGDRGGLDRDALARVLGAGSGRSLGAEIAADHEAVTGMADGPARRALAKDVELLASTPGSDGPLSDAAASGIEMLDARASPA